MNTKQIIQTLHLTNSANNIAHASKLCEIFKMCKTLSIIDTQVKDVETHFGTTSTLSWKNGDGGKRIEQLYGDPLPSKEVSIIAATGNYTITVPNQLYSYLMECLGVQEKEIKEVAGEVITFNEDVSSFIHSAKKFVGNDKYRPERSGVCFHFKNNKVQFVSTNANMLYLSGWVSCSYSGLEKTVIVDCNFFNSKKEVREIIVSDDSVNINGVNHSLIDALFPNYENVIPDYKGEMLFNRKDFLGLIKTAILSANKTTKQCNLHLNGQIDINSFDLDWGKECNTSMIYEDKTFPDVDISFNGDFLLKSLSVFKSENVTMKSDGMSNRAVLFNSGGSDSVLLMPVMIY